MAEPEAQESDAEPIETKESEVDELPQRPVSEKVTLQLFTYYRGPNKELQFKNEDVFFANLGARYTFLNKLRDRS